MTYRIANPRDYAEGFVAGFDAARKADEADGFREAPKGAEAVVFLHEQLADGPKASTEIRTAAREAGIHWAALDRASRLLRITKTREGFGGPAVWSLNVVDYIPGA